MECFSAIFDLLLTSKNRERELQHERIKLMRQLECAKTAMQQFIDRCRENAKSKEKLIDAALKAQKNGLVLVYRNSIKLQKTRIANFETHILKFEELQTLLLNNKEQEMLYKTLVKTRDALNLVKIDKIECSAHMDEAVFEMSNVAEQQAILNAATFGATEHEHISEELTHTLFPACPKPEPGFTSCEKSKPPLQPKIDQITMV